MFKCPNCHKMFMQFDFESRSLVCYGSRCHQIIEVPRRLWGGRDTGIPRTEDLQECIDAFKRARRR